MTTGVDELELREKISVIKLTIFSYFGSKVVKYVGIGSNLTDVFCFFFTNEILFELKFFFWDGLG